MPCLTLPAPCPQPWDAMAPTATGRHCTACAKTVVDFTQQTDAEILAYFRQGHAGTCGRFRAAQLGRPLAAATSPVRLWQHWLAALLLAALATPGCTPDAPRQAAPPVAVRPPRAAPSPAALAPSAASAVCSPALLGYTVSTKAPRPPALQKVRLVPPVPAPAPQVVGEPAIEHLPGEMVVGKPALPPVADSVRTTAPTTY